MIFYNPIESKNKIWVIFKKFYEIDYERPQTGYKKQNLTLIKL